MKEVKVKELFPGQWFYYNNILYMVTDDLGVDEVDGKNISVMYACSKDGKKECFSIETVVKYSSSAKVVDYHDVIDVYDLYIEGEKEEDI